MRPRISWADLAGARVGVWGLGTEGQANLRRLQSMGTAPVLVDDRPPAGAGPEGAEEVLATAAGGIEALARCDVVVKAPGISRYRPEVRRLEESGVAVAGGLGLWLEGADRPRVACVTGTKGKSTTTTIAAHLLSSLGHPALACGNLGLVPWDPEGPSDPRWWIVETSSFQATDLSCAPAVVAVTSLHPDHLDWHGDAETYYADKLSACTQPGGSVTVAAGEDPLLRLHAGQLGPSVRWVPSPPRGDHWSDPLGLAGPHNRSNAEIARAVLAVLGIPEAGDDDALRQAAGGYGGLDSRLRPIGDVGGVTFVDDSLSTNALSALAALAAYPDRRVALLVGGHDRGIDYSSLAQGLALRSAPTFVVALPDNGPRIAAAVRAAAASSLPVAEVPSLEEGVVSAYRWARPDGVVLLSPAAPSFGQFADFRDRAATFKAAMESCA